MKKNQKKKPTPGKQAIAYSLTRKGMTTWFCLIFFICAWMFVLGVLVGRGTAPVHFDISALQKELADLRKAVIKKDEKRYTIRQTSNSGKPDLDFHETLKKKKDDSENFAGRFAKTDKSPLSEELKSVRAADAPEALPRKAKTSLKSLTFKNKIVNSKAVQPKTVAGRVGKHPVGQFIIQVASIKDSKQADKMTADLKTRGYQAYRVSAGIPGKGTWHRVRVAGFQTRAAGEAGLKRLKKDGFDGFLLKR